MRHAYNPLLSDVGEPLTSLEGDGQGDDDDDDGDRSDKALRRYKALQAQLDELEDEEAFYVERLGRAQRKELDMRERLSTTQSVIEQKKIELEQLDPNNPHWQMKVKQQQLVQATDTQQHVRELIANLDTCYNNASKSLKERLQTTKRKAAVQHMHSVMKGYAGIMRPQTEPGSPSWLGWVEGGSWRMIGGLAPLLALVFPIIKFTHPSATHSDAPPEIFLLFFLVELALNLAYFKHRFLFGPFEVVWYNWLDVIVVAGSGMQCFGTVPSNIAAYFPIALSLSRLARVFKNVGVIFLQDLSWLLGPSFQHFMLWVILFNCMLLGLETDYDGLAVWPALENVMLLLYVFELVLKVYLDRCYFFCGSRAVWNWLDLIVVFGGISEQWVLRPAIQLTPMLGIVETTDWQHRIKEVMTALKAFQLVRILRLARAFRGLPQLYSLAIGVAKAMEGMGWVLIFAVCILYVNALVFVNGGHFVLYYQDADKEEMTAFQTTFANIPDTFFALFMVMNADLSMVEAVIENSPFARFVLIGFVIVTNWAVFSFLTGVVTDKMAAQTMERERKAEAQLHAQHVLHQEGILGFFWDHLEVEGKFTRSVCPEILRHEALGEELCTYTGLGRQDLEELFDLMGDDMTRADFMRLLAKESMPLTQRPLMHLATHLEQFRSWLEIKSGDSDDEEFESEKDGVSTLPTIQPEVFSMATDTFAPGVSAEVSIPPAEARAKAPYPPVATPVEAEGPGHSASPSKSPLRQRSPWWSVPSQARAFLGGGGK